MRIATRILGAVLLLAGAAAIGAAQEGKALKPGATIPGAFQTLMVTGDRAGKFHCPVCEYDQRPAVLVLVRDVEAAGPAVAGFLQKVDALIAKYPKARLGACAVFVNDGGYHRLLQSKIDNSAKVTDLELTRAILAKEDKEARIKDLAKKAELKNVTLGLGSPEQLAKYLPDPNADVTVVFYNRQQIVSVASFAKDQFNEGEAGKILKEIETTLTQAQKPAPAGGRNAS